MMGVDRVARPDSECITDGIWRVAVEEGHNLDTAQGRAAFDRRLRSELAEIEDEFLRSHAAEIIRRKRDRIFHADHGDDHMGLLRRLRVIEEALGLNGPAEKGQ